MLLALIAKFTQHEDCKAVLLATGDKYLVEDTGKGRNDDHIWGDGSTDKGKNLLGKAIMELRKAIREKDVDKLEKRCRLHL
ncbi:hypothetical protein LCGC14_0469540 [marine sediment metagenome]|uniref:NADAR domain-containing protein n=1 Tax=marine sediment metagenome TaxID=412755 RepID=A0A0F9SHS9_9ZZZZ